jgi:hypothetical protein
VEVPSAFAVSEIARHITLKIGWMIQEPIDDVIDCGIFVEEGMAGRSRIVMYWMTLVYMLVARMKIEKSQLFIC